MPVGVALGTAAASVGSAAIGASASRSAGRQVQQSTDRAADLQNQQFQQLLRLQMPGYNRAENAAGWYGQLLGIPSMTQGQAPGMNYGQPGGMTGQGAGWQARMAGADGGASYYQPGMQQDQVSPSYAPGGENFQGPQINPGVPGQQPSQPPMTGGVPTMTGTGQGGTSVYDYIRNLPGYQDQLREGIGAIDRAASARGNIASGQRLKALNQYGQRTFGGFYNDYLNRVGQMAGQAPVIAQGIGNAGMQNAANVGNLMVQGGQARAQGSLGAAQSWQGGIRDLAGIGGWYGGQRGWF